MSCEGGVFAVLRLEERTNQNTQEVAKNDEKCDCWIQKQKVKDEDEELMGSKQDDSSSFSTVLSKKN